MTVYYLDASAIAKRYLRESGSAWMEDLTGQFDTHRFVSAAIVSVEVIAAIARALRQQRVGRKQAQQAIARFGADAQIYWRTWAVTNEVLMRASVLTMRHPLRAYDAVHLATALMWADDLAGAGLPAPTVISADRDLLAAAQAEGLPTDNPNDHA